MALVTMKISLSSLVFPVFQPGCGSGDGVVGEGVERVNTWTHLYSSCFISTICQPTMAGSVQVGNNQPGTAQVEELPDWLDLF